MGSKKRFVALAAVLLMVTSPALYADHPVEPEDPDGAIQSSATAAASASAVSHGGDGGSADASATGGAGGSAAAEQMQTAQGGAGGAGGDASNLGNNQTIAVNSRYQQKRQAPSVFAPSVYASGPCAYGWSAGASIPGGGASFGKAKPDTNCDRRELARVLTPLNPDLALRVLCNDPLILELNRMEGLVAGDCSYMGPPLVITRDVDQKPRADSSEPPPLDPRYATKEQLDKAFKQSQSK